jgi:hypothetical protein
MRQFNPLYVKAFLFAPYPAIFRLWESVWLARHAPRNEEFETRNKPHVEVTVTKLTSKSSFRLAQSMGSTGKKPATFDERARSSFVQKLN